MVPRCKGAGCTPKAEWDAQRLQEASAREVAKLKAKHFADKETSELNKELCDLTFKDLVPQTTVGKLTSFLHRHDAACEAESADEEIG